jgi:hypothetical protein
MARATLFLRSDENAQSRTVLTHSLLSMARLPFAIVDIASHPSFQIVKYNHSLG